MAVDRPGDPLACFEEASSTKARAGLRRLAVLKFRAAHSRQGSTSRQPHRSDAVRPRLALKPISTAPRNCAQSRNSHSFIGPPQAAWRSCWCPVEVGRPPGGPPGRPDHDLTNAVFDPIPHSSPICLSIRPSITRSAIARARTDTVAFSASKAASLCTAAGGLALGAPEDTAPPAKPLHWPWRSPPGPSPTAALPSTTARLALSTFSLAHFVPQLILPARRFRPAPSKSLQTLEGAHLTDDRHRQIRV